MLWSSIEQQIFQGISEKKATSTMYCVMSATFVLRSTKFANVIKCIMFLFRIDALPLRSSNHFFQQLPGAGTAVRVVVLLLVVVTLDTDSKQYFKPVRRSQNYEYKYFCTFNLQLDTQYFVNQGMNHSTSKQMTEPTTTTTGCGSEPTSRERLQSVDRGSKGKDSLSSIQQVLKLNCKGTKLLQSQRYEKAVKALSSCLAVIKEDLASGDDTAAATAAAVVIDVFPATHVLEFRFPEAQSSLPLQQEYGIFTSPIQIIAEKSHRRTSLVALSYLSSQAARNSPSSSLSSFAVHQLSFAVLFNTGLSFHLAVLSTLQNESDNNTDGDDNETSSLNTTMQRQLQKALAFYEAAYATMQEEHQNHEGNHNSTSNSNKISIGNASWDTVGRLALLNNMGQLKKLLRDSVGAQTCHEEMLSHILAIMDVQQRRRIFQFKLFFHSAIQYVLAPPQSAEAA